ncbi:MAG: DNA cytosine methyltransferase [Cyanothece sp. SIO2G6]|nr:DNA cytosine methyltransferase [Cyanothece sp. SIO2G6]
MGLDLGLEQAGIKAAAYVEIDKDAVSTIEQNRPNIPVLSKSIQAVTGEELKLVSGLRGSSIDLLAGGPPCQSFSVFGQRKGIQDLRGQMIFEFVRLADELKPHVFLMENVRGLLSTPVVAKKDFDPREMDLWVKEKGSLLNLLFEKFNDIGYRVDCFVVNAANYGAPQIRERILLIGNRHGLFEPFPEPMYSNRSKDGLPPFKTLREVIGDGFIDPCPEVMNFSERKLRYLAMVPPGGNWRSLPEDIQKESMGKSWYLKGGRSAYWRKLSFDFPSPTVVTMPNHAGTSMCRPSELRAISVGEAAAIQEFPNDWIFSGNTSSKFRQIGNAVPVRLGRVAGEVIMRLLDRIASEESPNKSLSKSQIIHIRPHVRTRTFYKAGTAYAGNHCYYSEAKPARDGIQLKLFEQSESNYHLPASR